jgi:transposase
MELISHTDYKALYEEQKSENASLRQEVMKMQLYVRKLSQIVFGSKSERFIPNAAQLALGMNIEAAAPACSVAHTQKVEYIKTSGTPKKQRVVEELGAYLNALPHVYETREPEHIPPGAVKIGEDRVRVLEVDPGKLFVKVTIIPKYKLPSEDDTSTTIIAAPAPERPLPRCVAGPSVLAQILVDKYCDHLPVFRQVKRFERSGVCLPYNTILDWAGKTIDLMEVLFEALKKEILETNYIHVDETGLKVLCSKENKKKRKIHDGYLWCYHNSIKHLVFFDYQHGRGEKCAEGILKFFRGTIQTDGWQVYEKVAAKQKEIIQICCLAHARRKFDEAKEYDPNLAVYALMKFQGIYDIERHCRDEGLSFDEVTKVRQDKTVPILVELHDWMIRQYKTLLPSDHLTAAINYSLERWDRLCAFTENGMLKPDNNSVERSIRPVALGRKNFLFAGSQKGAERIARIYSLLGTCKINNVNPYEWLKDVIGRINAHPINRISELLPHNWKALREKAQ